MAELMTCKVFARITKYTSTLVQQRGGVEYVIVSFDA